MWLPCGSIITKRVFDLNSANLSGEVIMKAPKTRRDFDFCFLAAGRCLATLPRCARCHLPALALVPRGDHEGILSELTR